MNVDYIFYAKVVIRHEFFRERQTVSSRWYTDVIKRQIGGVHRIRTPC
jgi:hypothetical protein